LIPASTLEPLAFLLNTALLFLLFDSPLQGLNYSSINAKEGPGTCSEEPVNSKSPQPIDPLLSLENIENEEQGAKAQKRVGSVAYNPIRVLRNIED
jgi:hypothetical protein